MKRSEQAETNFKNGYNCSQAVILAFADLMKIEPVDNLVKLASSFGGGIGRMREVCGAASAMFMIAGALKGYNDPKDIDAKTKHYELIQKLAKKFKDETGSIICRDMLGLKKDDNTPATPEARTTEYYQKRPCPKLCALAAKILEEELNL
ncbi:MAG: C-GCAxxG-C-C family protein [Alphaproteobacteria bacterium]|nr:C-GCAxxG-C-C family protein [Alphaproteobacteria bacterium]